MAQIINMPKLGFDMAEGTLVRWVVNEGENITKGAVLAEIETDKATVEVESSYSGVLLRQLVTQGAVVPINDPIAVIGEVGEAVDLAALVGKPAAIEKTSMSAQAVPAVEPKSVSETPTTTSQPVPIPAGGLLASPIARSMATELGIDLRQVHGTGPGGRITRKDIEAF